MLTASPRSAWIVIAWSLGLIASLAGWGALVARFLDEDERSRLGLRLGWGTAAVLVVGGPLLALHLAYGKVLGGVVIVGWALLLHDLWRRRAGFRPALASTLRDAAANPATAIMALVVAGAALLILTASAFETTSTFRTDDDTVAYLSFPREMVLTGGSVQPFSYRHAYSLNGQSFLLALLLPHLHVEELFVLDRGIFLVIALIMVTGLSERPLLQRAPYALLPELVLALLPNTRVNTTSMLTGTVALLTLYSALRRHKRGGSVRQAVGVALAVFATIALRPAYGPPVALALAAAYGAPLWKERKDRARRRVLLSEALVVGAATLAFLVPWMIVAYRSDATPLFPLLRGTVRKLDMGGHGGFFFVPRIVWSALMADDAFRAPLILALAGLCLVDTSDRPVLRPWVLSPIVALAALLFFDPRAIQVNAIRYALPVVLAAVLVVGARAMTILEDLGPESVKRDVAGAAIAVLGLLLHLHAARDPIAHEFTDAVNTLRRLDDAPPVLGAHAASYRALQDHTEPGSTILAMTLRPHLFDFAHNRVTLLDYPGLAGPRGGFPVDGTDADYLKYLRDNGIQYLAISTERPDPYDLGIWRPRLKDFKSRTDVEAWAQAAWAPVFVYVVEAMERLSTQHATVWRDANIMLIDLTKPRS